MWQAMIAMCSALNGLAESADRIIVHFASIRCVRTRHHSPVTLLVLSLWWAGMGQAQQTETRLPTLTHVIQARKLTEEEAKRKYPVHFRVAVTYSTYSDLFVQDSTGAIWVGRPTSMEGPRRGQLLDLEGVTTQTDFAPDIAEPRWRVLGEAPMPAPRHPTYDQMASTSEDSKWVELEGLVRSAVEVPPDGGNSRHLRLNLVVDGNRLVVEIADTPSRWEPG